MLQRPDSSAHPSSLEGLADEAEVLLDRLFPICRSLTGNGVRQTLAILSEVAEFEVKEIASGTAVYDWVIPDEGGIRWMQSLAVFETSARKDLANKFVQYVLSPDGQGRLATSACYWAMPANAKATLTGAQKKTLRWDEQPSFLPKSYHYLSPDPELDNAMLEVWTEFLNA